MVLKVTCVTGCMGEIKATQLLKYQRHKELDLGVPQGDILGFLLAEKLVKFSTG